MRHNKQTTTDCPSVSVGVVSHLSSDTRLLEARAQRNLRVDELILERKRGTRNTCLVGGGVRKRGEERGLDGGPRLDGGVLHAALARRVRSSGEVADYASPCNACADVTVTGWHPETCEE